MNDKPVLLGGTVDWHYRRMHADVPLNRCTDYEIIDSLSPKGKSLMGSLADRVRQRLWPPEYGVRDAIEEYPWKK